MSDMVRCLLLSCLHLLVLLSNFWFCGIFVLVALLPYCIRSLVCAMVHNLDEHIGPWDVQNVLAFYCGKPAKSRSGNIVDTVSFRPTRLVFQNFRYSFLSEVRHFALKLHDLWLTAITMWFSQFSQLLRKPCHCILNDLRSERRGFPQHKRSLASLAGFLQTFPDTTWSLHCNFAAPRTMRMMSPRAVLRCESMKGCYCWPRTDEGDKARLGKGILQISFGSQYSSLG